MISFLASSLNPWHPEWTFFAAKDLYNDETGQYVMGMLRHLPARKLKRENRKPL
jgi:hypothetical protein